MSIGGQEPRFFDYDIIQDSEAKHGPAVFKQVLPFCFRPGLGGHELFNTLSGFPLDCRSVDSPGPTGDMRVLMWASVTQGKFPLAL